uniref:BESS domain-containing protein n=1 Tax=Photinus pyralis TaxID=7054 RepID=A0A1Y1M5B6_PHOPY
MSKWPYFNMLLFLKDTMTSRILAGNVPNIPAVNEISDVEVGDVEEQELEPTATPTTDNDIENKNITKKMKKRKTPNDIDEKLLEIEEKKLKYFERNTNDDDYQFLMSLLPYLKDVSKTRKLIVRAKLQQVLIDEQTDVPNQSLEWQHRIYTTSNENVVYSYSDSSSAPTAIREDVMSPSGSEHSVQSYFQGFQPPYSK